MNVVNIVRGIKPNLAVAAISVFCCTSTRAAITLDLDNATTYANTGINAKLDANNSFIVGNELIGIYGFIHGGTPALPDNGPGSLFWSVCLDPLGTIDWGKHNYERLTFAEASPGLNPSQWFASGSDFYGIQNASYIWRNNYSSVLTSSTDKQAKGTALALALYEALYDSTGYGKSSLDTIHSLPGNHFTVTAGLTGSVLTWYNTYLNTLSGFSTSSDIYNGYVLRGAPVTNGENGQEFVLIGTPVPEASTIIAGALLLLPFGVSTLRSVRLRAGRKI
jgi:hypothetical protein